MQTLADWAKEINIYSLQCGTLELKYVNRNQHTLFELTVRNILIYELNLLTDNNFQICYG